MEVLVYSSNNCHYCDKAKKLLSNKNISYNEIRVDLDEKAKQTMIEKSQRRTVPQIFINGMHIGGYTDLYDFDNEGKLDALLNLQD